MNIASALYCVVIHRYTECYTSVIHGVILPLLYIWRNGPYIGGHHAFIFKLNFKHIYNLV